VSKSAGSCYWICSFGVVVATKINAFVCSSFANFSVRLSRKVISFHPLFSTLSSIISSNYNQRDMYFTTALFAGLVLANIVTSTSIVKQADGPLPTNGPPSLEPNETTTKTTQHRRSHNWAGAVLRGSDFQTVTGTFVVPEVILPDDAHSHKRHAASA
jgi:hypothetical protein